MTDDLERRVERIEEELGIDPVADSFEERVEKVCRGSRYVVHELDKNTHHAILTREESDKATSSDFRRLGDEFGVLEATVVDGNPAFKVTPE